MRSIIPVLLFSLAVSAQTPGIRLNQVGYRPDSPKLAMVVAPSPVSQFRVFDDKNGKVVFSGQAASVQQDANSGDSIQLLDFSALNKPGKYVVSIEGAGPSHPFEISGNVYQNAFYLAMRSFYGQRCGTKVDLSPDFPQYKYDACHLSGEWHESSGKGGARASVKGWHDAGDYGRYVVNSGITTGTLLWAYEMYSPALAKIKLNIPESKNATPDVLDEIRWNLEWMLSMQDADGGVFHKQTTPKFSGFVMPEKDTMPSVVIGTGKAPFKSSCATGDFAAAMAIAARVYKPFDASFSGIAQKAAENAWTWLQQNPNVLFNNPAGISTGGYGDRDCRDEALWAAAELSRTTGKPAYEAYFKENYGQFKDAASKPPSWGSVGALGLWSYWMSGRSAEEIKAWTLDAAAGISARLNSNPYRIAMQDADFVWGSNAVAANYSLLLLVAHRMDATKNYKAAALEHLHYLLGRNTFSISWVTQVGTNWFKHPHHRPSGADGVDEPWPGLISGGPNRRPQDPAMKKLAPGLPPMRMWVDDQESYASNENAINWNAALVFLLAAGL